MEFLLVCYSLSFNIFYWMACFVFVFFRSKYRSSLFGHKHVVNMMISTPFISSMHVYTLAWLFVGVILRHNLFYTTPLFCIIDLDPPYLPCNICTYQQNEQNIKIDEQMAKWMNGWRLLRYIKMRLDPAAMIIYFLYIWLLKFGFRLVFF